MQVTNQPATHRTGLYDTCVCVQDFVVDEDVIGQLALMVEWWVATLSSESVHARPGRWDTTSLGAERITSDQLDGIITVSHWLASCGSLSSIGRPITIPHQSR